MQAKPGEFDVLDESDGETGTKFWVMHPLHCVISRASNTANLPGYDSAHALEQLRFSIRILRAFLVITVLETYKETRAALKLVKRLYAFSHNVQAALAVFEKHGVDVFEGAPPGGFGLSSAYEELGYPKMVERLIARRKRFGVKTCALELHRGAESG